MFVFIQSFSKIVIYCSYGLRKGIYLPKSFPKMMLSIGILNLQSVSFQVIKKNQK